MTSELVDTDNALEMDDAEGMRINRWFTDQGICSRRAADRYINEGRVTINGQLAELGSRVGPEDRVALDGQVLRPRAPRPIVIAYNKPVGIECTSDPKVPENIIAAVNYPERLVHVGRLDQMSEGLILLTNRGEIVNRILRSEFEHEKEYRVELSSPISDEDIERLSRGVDIDDGRGKTKPCKIKRLSETKLEIILTEGRNRQIRRMAEVVRNHVKRLERVRVMHVRLGTLPRGQWRHLSADEMREIFLALGLERPAGSLRPPRHRPTQSSFMPPVTDVRDIPDSKFNRPEREGRGFGGNRSEGRPERGEGRGFGGHRAEGRPERGEGRGFGGNRPEGRPERGEGRGFGGNRPEGRPERGEGRGFGGNRPEGRPERGEGRGFGGNRPEGRPERGEGRGFGGNRPEGRPERTEGRGFGNRSEGGRSTTSTGPRSGRGFKRD